MPWQHASSRRLPHHPRASRSSPLLRFVPPRQHGPHRRFPHASGPSSLPRQQQASLRKPLRLPALPLATHMRNEPCVSSQSPQYACPKGSRAPLAEAPSAPGRSRRKRKYDTRDWSRKMGGAGRLVDGGCDWRGPGHGGRSSSGGGKAAVRTDGFARQSLGPAQCFELCSSFAPPLDLELRPGPSGPEPQGWRAQTLGTA